MYVEVLMIGYLMLSYGDLKELKEKFKFKVLQVGSV